MTMKIILLKRFSEGNCFAKSLISSRIFQTLDQSIRPNFLMENYITPYLYVTLKYGKM